jgi:uncharacterized membrane protein
MQSKAAITVHRSREETQRLWSSPEYRSEYLERANAEVSFKDAPGDRGTEIHVDLSGRARGGKLADVVAGLVGSALLAQVKDELRRFKQHVETGEIPRSDATPEGESARRKLKQRPAQPLPEPELEHAGAR